MFSFSVWVRGKSKVECKMSIDQLVVLNLSSVDLNFWHLRFPKLSLILIDKCELVILFYMSSVLAFAFVQLYDNPSRERR